MKIAYVYDAVYPWVKGGAEKRIYELSSRLAKRGHEVHCYGMKWWTGEDEILQGKVHLHGICPPMPLYSNGRRSISQAAFFAGKLLAQRIDCDVMDCQNFPYLSCFSAKLLTSLRGQKLFITWHEVWGDYWQSYLGEIGRAGQAVEWSAARLTERNIAVSARTQRDLLSLGARAIAVVPNGIDWQGINRVHASSTQSDIIYVGRLVGHKNLDLLIRALAIVKEEIPDVKAVIVGDGPENEKLKSLVNEKKLAANVDFKGFLENYNEALSLMKSSRIFVAPSAREGFGMAALEANACGLPVITIEHKMNAVMDLVTKKTGSVCLPTEQALAEAISRILPKKEEMRGRCIEEAKKYDWETGCERAERAYANRTDTMNR
ncbi:MAG: UDP-D-galactose:(glucosyl)lipopolysaccharide-1,6-D-galactosyltransferase [Methanosaeta sp. PtaU1.Bin112]|nr:MAG: UDP-D-galactose:(glucosyl)lipopolysaccharide-1,6-D-galactosyltransferase [Methanosaeta sp. PtaU1.Bin112]